MNLVAQPPTFLFRPFKQSYCIHVDVIKWKHFPRYWPFVRGIHRCPVNFTHRGQWREALMFFFYMRLNKQLSKQTWGWWFETLSRPLWRHRNAELLHKRYPYNPNTITTARDTLPWASPTHTSSAWEVFVHTRGVVCSDWWTASKILRAIVVSVLPNSYCRSIIRNLFTTVNYPTLYLTPYQGSKIYFRSF